MAPLVSTIEIACTPEEIFAVATDPHRFAEWQHDVVNVRMLGEARFATTRRISGAERTMIQQITPERSSLWLGRARHRRPHPYERHYHRRAGQRRYPVTSHLHS
jgi:hypothetical protein